MDTKPVNETLYLAVDPTGLAIWYYQQLRYEDVEELLDRDHPDWRAQGWRIAKVRMTEITSTP